MLITPSLPATPASYIKGTAADGAGEYPTVAHRSICGTTVLTPNRPTLIATPPKFTWQHQQTTDVLPPVISATFNCLLCLLESIYCYEKETLHLSKNLHHQIWEIRWKNQNTKWWENHDHGVNADLVW